MDDAVRITAGVAVVAIVLALLFLPARALAARPAVTPQAAAGPMTAK